MKFLWTIRRLLSIKTSFLKIKNKVSAYKPLYEIIKGKSNKCICQFLVAGQFVNVRDSISTYYRARRHVPRNLFIAPAGSCDECPRLAIFCCT